MAKRTPTVEALYEAMGGLYRARYTLTRTLFAETTDKQPKAEDFSSNTLEFDEETFNDIVRLQIDLQILILKLGG